MMMRMMMRTIKFNVADNIGKLGLSLIPDFCLDISDWFIAPNELLQLR
jgi:hypothetical protein